MYHFTYYIQNQWIIKYSSSQKIRNKYFKFNKIDSYLTFTF